MGQGQSDDLLNLWRDYLEQYADREGDVAGQTVAAAYHAVEVFTAFSRALDYDDKYKELIDERISLFHEGIRRAANFENSLINATFSIYNSLNTLAHQLTEGNAEAAGLIGQVDEQVHRNAAASGDALQRSAAALRACFPLLSLMAIALDQDQVMTGAIRQVERRFAAGAGAASSDWEHAVNALYRIVEMIQICTLLTDPDLRDRIDQIATRFKEEDQTREAELKLRNGFCRLFELGHLLVTHLP